MARNRKAKVQAPKQVDEPPRAGGEGGEAEVGSKGFLSTIKAVGAHAIEAVRDPAPVMEAVRDHVMDAAEAVDRTLESLKEALDNVDEKVERAQDWTAEKATKIDQTLGAMRDTVASAADLVEATQSRARIVVERAGDALTGALSEPIASGTASPAEQLPGVATISPEECRAGGSTLGLAENKNVTSGSLAPETGTPLAADRDPEGGEGVEDEEVPRKGSTLGGDPGGEGLI